MLNFVNLLVTLLLAISVRDDQAPLRSGCDASSPVVRTLPAGTDLTIRFALASEGCYKVAATVDGKKVEGYLSTNAIAGLGTFEQARREAAWISTAEVLQVVQKPRAAPTELKLSSNDSSVSSLMSQAAGLIEASQPGKALSLLEPIVQKRRDPSLLAMAGVAAWRADQSKRALEYWRGSLDINPDADLEALYRRVEKEAANDQSTERMYGNRVLLRYDTGVVSPETARQMGTVVDETFARVSAQLGCTAEERIVAIVQSREAYRKATDAAEWSGGLYDGRIRLPLLTQDREAIDRQTIRALAHETTHACLTMLGRWPAWLQEGMAQKLSGDTLSPSTRAQLLQLARDNRLPRLSQLGQNWSRLNSEQAQLAYQIALLAAETLYSGYGTDGVRNLMRNPDRLRDVTADIERRLAQ
jgi:hypothetical protein